MQLKKKKHFNWFFVVEYSTSSRSMAKQKDDSSFDGHHTPITQIKTPALLNNFYWRMTDNTNFGYFVISLLAILILLFGTSMLGELK